MSADTRTRFVVVLCTLAASLLLTSVALAQQGPKLPAAPIEPKVRTACAECHDAQMLLQQRLSRGAWTKEVDKMIRWGAVVDPKDRDAIIDYLSTNFPPDKPAYVPAGARIATAPRKR
jgi:mono/diheme cytochrome c family protein